MSIVVGVLVLGTWRWSVAEDPESKNTATLTVYVEGVNKQGGNVAVMVFRSANGWPEDNDAAYRAVVVPAHPGTMVVRVALPPGEYAIAVGHDVNLNKKVDRNWLGKPTEQWGMSNNPHPKFRTPDFSKAKFVVAGNEEIRIEMQ
jgi:uncharacterized protein (DUF2141 family)